MKLPLSWLKEFIPLTQTPEEIASLLTDVGIEVEGIHKTKCQFTGVIVAEVIQTANHPDADRLKIATVNDGTEHFQVVCGASNCRVGLKTAFAKIGAELTDKDGKITKIKKGKLRGVESFGMLASADELGLEDSSDGIIELPQDTELGISISSLYNDAILDITLTPNLIHCASVLGIARELKAQLQLPITLPQAIVQEKGSTSIENYIHVEIEEESLCPRYMCRLIKNVKVGPSPKWLKDKLEAAGFRSINNVVDITNFCLMEYGHPLHAFDYTKIHAAKLQVHKAIEGSTIVTLDGIERKLNQDMLIISNRHQPLAIAGVMGGKNAEVNLQTQDVLLEAAFFNPQSIRKTSKTLALSTEASKHFERGIDPNQIPLSLERASALLQEIAHGQVVPGVVDIKKRDFPPKTITLRIERINKLLGTHLSYSEVALILEKLDCHITFEGQEVLHVLVPTYRGDLLAEIDLVEEVARIYGYNHIKTNNLSFKASLIPHAPAFLFERQVRDSLVRLSLQEFLTCDLISPTLSNLLKSDKVTEETIISVLNPTSIEQSVLRLSLLPGLLQVVKNNQDHFIHHIHGFEVGRVHFRHEGQLKEHTNAAIILCGKSAPSGWQSTNEEVDFYTLKGKIESFLESLYFMSPQFRPSSLNCLHPKRQAALFIEDKMIGSMGEVHPSILRELGITKRVLFAEIDLHDLFKAQKKEMVMQPLATYPSITRDWTFEARKPFTLQTIFDFIETLSSPILESTSLKSIYKNPEQKDLVKNMTLHFVYRSSLKTLSIEEVDQEHQRLLNATLEFMERI